MKNRLHIDIHRKAGIGDLDSQIEKPWHPVSSVSLMYTVKQGDRILQTDEQRV